MKNCLGITAPVAEAMPITADDLRRCTRCLMEQVKACPGKQQRPRRRRPVADAGIQAVLKALIGLILMQNVLQLAIQLLQNPRGIIGVAARW